ncbi:glycosyltransferase family 39 protein [Sesbania bispinosa]|nr:glycosyltransferase family 39 protein [Sesbania bispinosa]
MEGQLANQLEGQSINGRTKKTWFFISLVTQLPFNTVTAFGPNCMTVNNVRD